MQLLNAGNNGGRTTEEDEEPTTTGQSHHPASTTSTRVCFSTLYNIIKRWFCVSKNIDWLARRMFPMIFIIFNVLYWSIYLLPPHFHCNLVAQGINKPCFETHEPMFHPVEWKLNIPKGDQ